MKREDVIREVQSMLHDLDIKGGYQVAKVIVRRAAGQVGGGKKLWRLRWGAGGVPVARPMTQEEAEGIVATATARIEAADEGEIPFECPECHAIGHAPCEPDCKLASGGFPESEPSELGDENEA